MSHTYTEEVSWSRSSLTIQTTLASDAGQPSPPTKDDPIEYFDGCLRNMGLREKRAKIETDKELVKQERRCESRCERQESRLNTRIETVKDEVRETVDDLKTKVGKHLKDMNRMLGAFCERVQTSLQEQNDRWDERFNGVEKSLRDSAAAHHNARAIFMNGILNRLHHEIVPIQVLIARRDGESEWRSSPMVPLTFGDVYRLGQRAKGIFISDRDLDLLAKNKEYQKQGPSEARDTIKSLCVYYNIEPHGEHLSQTDGGEVWLEDGDSVDLYLDQFLKRFGMSWDKVRGHGDKVCQYRDNVRSNISSQTGQKRSDRTGSGNEAKRHREDSSI